MDRIGPEKLDELLRRHGGPLVLYARQWCDAAEDVVQDVFLRLFQQTIVPDKIVGWLYRAVRNRAIDEARGEARRQRREGLVASNGEPWFKPTDGEGLDAPAVAAALEALPIDQRETIVARLWGGLSFGQIAELTGTSSSTAARRYQLGLATMRERLRVTWVKTKNSRPN
ncbi:MAG: RNA polymerase sigma factor [Pirellulales bacterium]|nr:RNA polymerase sigma factor [Pirellulales bacterium]